MIIAIHLLGALLSFHILPEPPAMAGQVSVIDFRASSDDEKRRILTDLSSRQAEAPPVAELASIVELAISDGDPRIREQGLLLFASRVGAPRFSADARILDIWRREIPRLRGFRSSVEAALKDGEPDVRDAAVLALGNLDAVESVRRTEITVDPRTVTALIEAFLTEPDPGVRTSIIKGLALSTNRSKQVSAVLIDAMRDRAAPVRQAATKGFLKVDISEALPVLVGALSDDDKNVRLSSARVIGQFGKAAGHLSDVLDTAATREKDAAMKTEFQRIARVLRAQK